MDKPHIVSALVIIRGPGTVVHPYCGISLQEVDVVPTKQLVDAALSSPHFWDGVCPDCYAKYLNDQKSFMTETIQLVTGTKCAKEEPTRPPLLVRLTRLIGFGRPRSKLAA